MNYFKGKKRGPMTIEHKQKIVETRRSNNSYIPWNKGTGKAKILKGPAIGNRNGMWRGGANRYPKCSICKLRLSSLRSSMCVIHKGITAKGAKNVNWKGGVTPENAKIRKSK